MVEDARRLYMRYDGKQHQRIEREMRGKGWTFYRELLYLTRHSHGVSPGWPERYGWTAWLERKLQRKRNAEKNKFEAWLKTNTPEWTWTWKYQRYIYDHLAAISSGASKRLMIFLPPRHGKSEMVTVRYVAWRLLQNPALNVILGSYNQKLADRFSRKIKRIYSDAERERRRDAGSDAEREGRRDAANLTLSASLRPAVSASQTTLRRLNTAAEWETRGGGVVRSVGVGAGIAGFGAGLIVIDDPVKNRAEAESETYRDRVYEWFNDDIYTRMEPNASIILIQTRWHEDDLAGRLLKEKDNGGEHWDVVSLPALAEPEEDAERERRSDAGRSDAGTAGRRDAATEISASLRRSFPASLLAASLRPALPASNDPLGRRPGEALCPKRYSAAALLRYKKKLGSYSFSALYQQQPVPLEGGRFKRAWFKNIVDEAPPGLRWKRGYDLAISTKTSADYTASFRCAFDKHGNLYIADGFRRRIEYPEQRRFIVDRMKSENNTEHGIEAAIHGQAVVQELRRERGFRQFAFRQVRVSTDKLTRALAWLNLAEEGKVHLVRGPWNDEFVDEVCRFPNGRHDDQVDAVSIAVNMLGGKSGDRRLYFFD